VYEEDELSIPGGFKSGIYLQKSIRDIAGFEQKKKLPFVSEVLKCAFDSSQADCFIYTNMDIALMPFFYEFVFYQLSTDENRALIINRRRLPSLGKENGQWTNFYSEIGLKHPGFDCFVFKRDLVKQFDFGEICIGVPFFEVAFAHNLFAFAESIL